MNKVINLLLLAWALSILTFLVLIYQGDLTIGEVWIFFNNLAR